MENRDLHGNFDPMRAFFAILMAAAIQSQLMAQPTSSTATALHDKAESERRSRDFKSEYLDGNPIRVVTNQVFNVQNSILWQVKFGVVDSISGDTIILSNISGGSVKFYAVKNYPGDATSGKKIALVAIRTGTLQWREMPLELWDYGTVPAKAAANRPPATAKN